MLYIAVDDASGIVARLAPIPHKRGKYNILLYHQTHRSQYLIAEGLTDKPHRKEEAVPKLSSAALAHMYGQYH